MEVPDLNKGPNEAWPVQLFFGAGGERKFKGWLEIDKDRSAMEIASVRPNMLYSGTRYLVFRDGFEVVFLPIGEVVQVRFYAPRADDIIDSASAALADFSARKVVFDLRGEVGLVKVVTHNLGTTDIHGEAFMENGEAALFAVEPVGLNMAKVQLNVFKDGEVVGRVAKAVIVG